MGRTGSLQRGVVLFARLSRLVVISLVFAVVVALTPALAGCEREPSPERASRPLTKIAFDSIRDGDYEIYVMNADGGGVRQLTDNDSYDAFAALSPNGQRIAFEAERDKNVDVFVMKVDGTEEVRLTDEEGFDGLPGWSPNGAKIAFTSSRSGSLDIYVMQADGTRVTRLTESDAEERSPTWSPDGSKIAFETIEGDENESGVYVMNSDGTEEGRLTEGEDPAWSPNGRKIAFARYVRKELPVQLDFEPDWNIYVVNPDGSGEVQLTEDKAVEVAPTWSPDGKTLVVQSTDDGYPEIFTMPAADGSRVANLQGDESGEAPSWSRGSPARLPATGSPADTSGSIDFVSQLGRGQDLDLFSLTLAGGKPEPLVEDTPGDAWDVARSPDGTQIAFSSGREDKLEIDVAGAGGAARLQLTHNEANDFGPTWSADGKTIAFASDRDGDYDVYAIGAGGRGERKLVDTQGADYEADWSPDGGAIAFTSDRDGDDEIFVVQAEGGPLRQLTDNEALDGEADWSPDGTTIAFTSDRDGLGEIYVMGADGGGEARLTENAAIDYAPAWSPDGGRIAFTSDRGFREYYRDTFNLEFGSFGYEIWVMNADGGGLRRLTVNEFSDSDPAWRPTGG
jgi:Tol biopolymer transport system component